MFQQIIATYHQLTEEGELQRSNIDNELDEVTLKLERLEERYVMEEITKDMFDKYAGKLQQEQAELEAALGKTGSRVSNLENCVQKAINLSSKLATVWHLSDYKEKQELQFLLFPDGIYYNRKTQGCRIPKINNVFSYISSLQRALGQKESGNSNLN